jgi:hypothetical protein
MTKIVNLFNNKDMYLGFEMLDYCHKTFGNQSPDTWELKNLSNIIFHNEKYYTMFILFWGHEL